MAAKKTATKKTAAKRTATKRTTIAAKGGKRYVRRGPEGQFTDDQVNVGRSLAADRRTHAKTVAPKGQGDRGDQKVAKPR